MTRPCLAAVLAVALSAIDTGAQNLQSFDPVKGTYAELATMYLSGRREDAVRWVMWLPTSRARAGVERIADSFNARYIKAAIMLHTEVATLASVDLETARTHLAMVEPLLRALSRASKTDRGAGDFMRHWYVVAASTMAARGAGATAARYVERAVDEFPTDKAVRFWQGYVEERRHRLQASERAYWRAVEYDPGYLEARLRLGFVLHEEGDYEQSRRQLELVRDAGGTALVRYLTHLFLGKSKEAANDFQGAAQEYEAAIWIGPFCQSAHVALSYAEERAGNHLKAQRLAARFAALPKDACAADPWWFHQFRSLDDEALTWLHDNVR